MTMMPALCCAVLGMRGTLRSLTSICFFSHHETKRSVDRIYNSLIRAPDGTARELPLVVPRPVPGLISKRVLVQDFLHGVYVCSAVNI